MAKIDIKIKMPSDAELAKMFGGVHQLDRYRVGDQVVRAGASPIVKRARSLAPRSTQESRNKRSRNQQASADWNYPLWKTIKMVVRKYQRGNAGAVVGPEWPKGNTAYFNTSPRGRVRKLWGKNPSVFSGANLSTIAPQIRNWIVKAFDETKPQQLSAMKEKLKAVMDTIWKAGNRG